MQHDWHAALPSPWQRFGQPGQHFAERSNLHGRCQAGHPKHPRNLPAELQLTCISTVSSCCVHPPSYCNHGLQMQNHLHVFLVRHVEVSPSCHPLLNPRNDVVLPPPASKRINQLLEKSKLSQQTLQGPRKGSHSPSFAGTYEGMAMRTHVLAAT